jgi:hypothetical protein
MIGVRRNRGAMTEAVLSRVSNCRKFRQLLLSVTLMLRSVHDHASEQIEARFN